MHFPLKHPVDIKMSLGPIHRRAAVAALCALLAAVPAAAQAFTSARVVGSKGYVSLDKVPPGSTFRVAVAVQIEHGWHVNAHEPTFDYLIATTLEIAPAEPNGGLSLGAPIYPPHIEQAFSFTDGKTLRVYEGTALIGLEARAARDLAPGVRRLTGRLTVQACNDTSCLAPAKLPIEIDVPIASAGEPVNAVHGEIFSAISFSGGAAFPDQAPEAASPDGNTVGRWVDDLGWGGALALIFLGGLALNLTPCVYPLIPITLAYFGGQASGRPGRTFALASIYVLGMCITYSALGVLAATTGSILGSVLQSPIALIFVAVVLVALGLSMFGLYDIQVPAAIRNRITSRPGTGGALFMGLTVGLVAAPCVGPFVVSLLAYVGQSGSPLLGFSLFFVLALGLGLPYLFLGGFAGAASGLPRAGAWMVWVKKVFGCVMFAMALYFLNPLMPPAVAGMTIPIVLLVSAVYLGLIEGSPIRTAGFRLARLSAAAACIAIAAALLMPAAASSGISWQPFTPEALARASQEGRPVIIDFTADWCLPCKELDRFTFSDPEVVAAATRFVMLKADITSQTSEPVQEVQRRYAIMGAPTIVFLDAGGRERRDLRLTGFESAGKFTERMRQVQ